MNSEKQNTTQSKSLLRCITPDAVAVVLFVLVSVAYFFTPITQGLVLSGNDITGGVGAGRSQSQQQAQRQNRCRQPLRRAGGTVLHGDAHPFLDL